MFSNSTTGGAEIEDMRIDSELRKLEGQSELDSELAVLKAKLAAETPKALEKARGSLPQRFATCRAIQPGIIG